MESPEPFIELGTALVLGLLVGLQRESREVPNAGVRTFAIVTLLGAAIAKVGDGVGSWVFGAGLLGVAGTVFGGKTLLARDSSTAVDPGLTTEIALLAMYVVGGWVVVGPAAPAIATGATIAILLHFKEQLHAFAAKLGESDLRSIMLLAAISTLVLPLLPDRGYGPFASLNPYETWLMVVLVMAINVAGYIAYRTLGERAGVLVGGALGGLISSTATTVGFSRIAQEHPGALRAAVVVILVSSSLVYPRMALELAVVSPPLLLVAGPWLAAVFVLSIGLVAIVWFRGRKSAPHGELPEQENPGQLRAALVFGALYAGICLGMAAADEYLGIEGLYAVAVFSGLTDVDAVTLSTARLAQDSALDPGEAWRLVLVAATANLVFKAGITAVMGPGKLARRIAAAFALLAALSIGLVIWVPR